MKICPCCCGNGYWMPDPRATHVLAHITCQTCAGAGEIAPRLFDWIEIGRAHRTYRVEIAHEGLAACAERLSIDDRDLNDMEHGRKDPAPIYEDIPEALRPRRAA